MPSRKRTEELQLSTENFSEIAFWGHQIRNVWTADLTPGAKVNIRTVTCLCFCSKHKSGLCIKISDFDEKPLTICRLSNELPSVSISFSASSLNGYPGHDRTWKFQVYACNECEVHLAGDSIGHWIPIGSVNSDI